jgi:Spy/CpxP family protein refolding chaperone
MRRKVCAAVVAACALGATAAPSVATTPPGQKGYEGHPGNQGGSHQAGQKGYEGQPGNQGGGH